MNKSNETQATGLQKNSNPEQIRQYFTKIMELRQSNEKFPVNLDDVWPLVYSRRQEAVRALTVNDSLFVEGVDYQILRRNAQQDLCIKNAENEPLPKNGEQDAKKWGGNNKVEYFLSVPCLEYFIARKVRPVFDIYREVFHRVADSVKSGALSSFYTAPLYTMSYYESQLINLTVAEGFSVRVLPDSEYGYLMPIKEVAAGYGVCSGVIRDIKFRNPELVDGKHFISNVTVRHAGSIGASRCVLWTLAGIVRLGDFVRSGRRDLFREWAKGLSERVEARRNLPGGLSAMSAGGAKRKLKCLPGHVGKNRIIRLLAIASQIDDKELRSAITNELTGVHYGNA